VTVAAEKSCLFTLHGAYADGSSTDSTSVDLCKDKKVIRSFYQKPSLKYAA
jgi:hypothetical protein